MKVIERIYDVGAGNYRICKTKCPFNEIMIGSGRCQTCKDFDRIDRDKQIVYCKRTDNET